MIGGGAIWKIEARELAEELLGGCVVGERGFNFSIKSAEVYVRDICSKPAAPGALHTFRQSIGDTDPVACIFVTRAQADIFPTIIQTVPVHVINNKVRWCIKNEPVHQQPPYRAAPEARAVHRVKMSAIAVKMPFPKQDALKIPVVDQHHMPTRQHELFHAAASDLRERIAQ